MPRTRGLLALLAAAALLAAPGRAQEETTPEPPPVLVAMGTASVTGVYFPVGVALCRLVNQHRRETGLRCAARPTEGSLANIAGLRDGSFQLAIVQSDVQAQAAAGAAGFAAAGPFDALRSVMALHPEPLTLVTRADAGITQVEDLAGKRVWLGTEGSGTRALSGDLMQALGWSADSFAPTPEIGADRLADALCDGEIDAFLYAIGHPALAIQEATTGCDARLVSVAGPAIDAVVASRSDLLAATIPGGLYRGNPGAVPTFGVGATLVTRADQPDERIHAMVDQIFADFDMLRGLEPVLTTLEPESMASEGLTAPLHPGAERYFRKRGWLE
jgi:TRAP transporter TAXI family solute receptor